MKLCFVSGELREPPDDLLKPWYIGYCKALDDVLKLCAKLEIKGIELSSPHIHEDMTTRELKELKSLVGSYGMEIVCLQSLIFLEQIDKKGFIGVKKYINMASQLDAKLIRIFSGPKGKNRDKLINYLTKSAKIASDHGVKLAIENIWTHNFGSIEELKRGIDEINLPNIGAILDFANFYAADEDPIRSIDTLTNRIFHTHCKDILTTDAGIKKWSILGEGELNYKTIISALKKYGYTDYLSIELHISPSKEALEKAVKILTPLIHK